MCVQLFDLAVWMVIYIFFIIFSIILLLNLLIAMCVIAMRTARVRGVDGLGVHTRGAVQKLLMH